MQTFLQYSKFSLSAQALDNKRLCKQIVECKQIFLALIKPDYGWKNHPAVKQWKGYEYALCIYALACCVEYTERFNKVHSLDDYFTIAADYLVLTADCCLDNPPWLGNKQYHSSHRAALLHKLPEHYKQFNWTEQPALNYYWPSKEKTNEKARI